MTNQESCSDGFSHEDAEKKIHWLKVRSMLKRCVAMHLTWSKIWQTLILQETFKTSKGRKWRCLTGMVVCRWWAFASIITSDPWRGGGCILQGNYKTALEAFVKAPERSNKYNDHHREHECGRQTQLPILLQSNNISGISFLGTSPTRVHALGLGSGTWLS